MANVYFRVGTRAEYDALEQHDSNALYWLSDTQELLKGDVLYGVGTEATEYAIGLMSMEDKKKINHINDGHTTPVFIADYLYSISYDSYDYEYGYEFMKRFKHSALCSAVRKGNIIGRNLDWFYSEHPNFIIQTNASCGRHATLGSCIATGNLTNEVAKSGADVEEYKILPFMTTDIINDCGVYININVVTPGDKGYTTGTGGGAQSICQLMIPRYVADYAYSAKNAIEIISKMNVYAPLNNLSEEAHFLICDENDSYIVEFVDNAMTVYSDTDPEYPNFPSNECILTNFYIDGWSGGLKTVYAGYTPEEVADTGLNRHAMGLERYQILRDMYADISSVNDMKSAMESVAYTKSYDSSMDPFWYSEFTGDYTGSGFGDITIYSNKEDFSEIVRIAKERYDKHERDSSSWITEHTSIYDIKSRKMYFYLEEDYSHRYEFQLVLPGVMPYLEWEDV